MSMSENNTDARWAMARHIIPFILWIGIMSLPLSNIAFRYTLQTVVSLVALLVLKPWQYYPAMNIRLLPLSVLVGAGVAIVWILPESGWIQQFPRIHESYVRYFIRGSDSGNGQLFAPEQCGWAYALMRLGGSALVIAVIEEYFWRGFFMRWLVNLNFLSVKPGTVGRGLFLIASLAFGFEHSRWLVGLVAGLAYGLLYCRKGDIMAAAAAHVTTNLLLGLYVLATASYQFW
jgi:CAAX prenyl protease-like protein